MPCVGSEPTIPASERANTVHDLDCSATVTGNYYHRLYKFLYAKSVGKFMTNVRTKFHVYRSNVSLVIFNVICSLRAAEVLS
jgi:hypothetical protein